MSDTYSNPADPGGGDGAVTPDIVVTDRQLFDDAVTTPEQQPPQRTEQQPPQQQPPQQPQQRTQPQQPQRTQPSPQLQPGEPLRNERGQFTSPRQAQQARPQQPPQGGGGAAPGEHHVPLRTYLDEREQRYRIQAEADQLRRAWADLEQRALAQHQQQQVPQTIYDNPEQYLQHNVMQPLRNEGHMAMLQIKDGLSREMANAQFGEQAVTTALQAMAQIRHTPDGNHIFQQIMSSGHPYGHLVNWFRRAQAQQAIGPDPHAWLRQQQEAWINDPRVQAEVMRRMQRQPPPQQQQQRQRGGPPNVQLPPSLSSLPASSGRSDQGGDMSDASLFAFATR